MASRPHGVVTPGIPYMAGQMIAQVTNYPLVRAYSRIVIHKPSCSLRSKQDAVFGRPR